MVKNSQEMAGSTVNRQATALKLLKKKCQIPKKNSSLPPPPTNCHHHPLGRN
jgi:hypothetical protein